MDFETLKLCDIEIPSHFCRQHYNEDYIDELAASIKVLGLLMPVVVRRVADKYILVDGSCRIRALQKLDISEVNAVIRTGDYVFSQSASLVANIQRDNLNPIEEAEAVRHILDDLKVGMPEIARLLGKSRDWVKDRIDIFRMPGHIKDALGEGKISMGVAKELSRIEDELVSVEYTRHASTGGCTKDMARQWVSQWELDKNSIYRAQAGGGGIPQPTGYERKIMVMCMGCGAEEEDIKMVIWRLCPHCDKEIRISLSEGVRGGS